MNFCIKYSFKIIKNSHIIFDSEKELYVPFLNYDYFHKYGGYKTKNKKEITLTSYPILWKQKKGDFKKLKDYFVPDSYLFNQWMEVYSRSELWGVLTYFFYQLQAPFSILFLLYIKTLLDILKKKYTLLIFCVFWCF